jgi:hypothetical protein
MPIRFWGGGRTITPTTAWINPSINTHNSTGEVWVGLYSNPETRGRKQKNGAMFENNLTEVRILDI